MAAPDFHTRQLKLVRATTLIVLILMQLRIFLVHFVGHRFQAIAEGFLPDAHRLDDRLPQIEQGVELINRGVLHLLPDLMGGTAAIKRVVDVVFVRRSSSLRIGHEGLLF
jgi:hypothetical protein